MTKKKEIFCTLGPSSLNKKFLKFANNNVSLLRLNMSHIKISKLKRTIEFVRKFSNVPICIDTEGAQIRTKVTKLKFCKLNSILNIYRSGNNFTLYPGVVFNKLKVGDILNIGFRGLMVKIKSANKKVIKSIIINSGYLENNKGVNISNRKIKLKYLTDKDFEAIKIAKKYKINYFALSFTNNREDIVNFNNLLKNEIKIYKLETRSAVKNLKKILSAGDKFLIDRGDLSKDVSIEMMPVIQRKIISLGKKMKKDIFVATNFLESMLENNYPTRGEVNDIYNTLELGAKGLVLASETAIGKFPVECVGFLKKIIKTFNQYH